MSNLIVSTVLSFFAYWILSLGYCAQIASRNQVLGGRFSDEFTSAFYSKVSHTVYILFISFFVVLSFIVSDEPRLTADNQSIHTHAGVLFGNLSAYLLHMRFFNKK